MPRSLGPRTSRRILALTVLLALLGATTACSDGSDASSSTSAEAADARRGSDATGGDDAVARAAERAAGVAAEDVAAAAEAASHAPSGIPGQVAPNDDDGARNLASVDPSTPPDLQATSGSMAGDPVSPPNPTMPEPGRPDVAGLLPLDGCAEISAPFYRAVSRLSATSTQQQLVDGVADLTIVAQRAQAPIAAAAQVLLTTAQTAAADAARIPDLGASGFQDAVRTVHVYLGDSCGR